MTTVELNICKICGKGFHYCVSCMVAPCRDEGYCSDKCWDLYLLEYCGVN